MDDFSTAIRELQADFQRIADRAPETRAVFTVNHGRFGFLTFGLKGGTGLGGSRLAGDRELTPDESVLARDGNPAYTELFPLTEAAGTLVSDLLRSKRLQLKMVSPKPIDYHLGKPWGYWLTFLMHSPPIFAGFFKGPQGGPYPVFGHHDELVGPVWIDNYPQVSVSGFSVLKAALLANLGKGWPPPPDKSITKLRPDQFDLGKGRIISDVSKKQLLLLTLLKDAGPGGSGITAACKHVGYKNDERGKKALAELARRINERLNDYCHIVERINDKYCLTRTSK